MRIVIAGGTGLIGKALARELVKARYEVVLLSRNPGQARVLTEDVIITGWDGKTAQGWGSLVDGAYAVINLAGESLAGKNWLSIRWTKSRKEEIIQSRLRAGQAIVEAVQTARVKPQALLQASAVGYYGPRDNQPIGEAEKPGSDFLATLCKDWENSTLPVEKIGIRRIVVRLGVVLSKEGGALSRQVLPFKLFVGGPLGSGKQGYPWIHIADAVRAMRFLVENPQAQGAFNLTAPQLVTNADFGRALGRAMHRPYYFPVPAFAIRLAFGEASTVLLDGQMPEPRRLQEMGFSFQFPDVDSALQNILR